MLCNPAQANWYKVMSQTQEKPKLDKVHYAWFVSAAGAAAIFCGLGLGRFTFGMMLPSMSESLGLSYSQGGVLGFSNMLGYLIAVLMSRIVLPRFGTRAVTSFSLLLIALSMAGMASTESYGLLCVLYCITGVGSGGVVVPAMSVMSHWFYPSHRGLASGIVMSGAGFGIIISGFVVPTLSPLHGLYSWQVGWLLFSAISVVVAALAFGYIRNHPRELGFTSFGAAPKASRTAKVEMPRAAKVRLLAHMGLLYGIYGATYMLYVTFIVTSMVDSYGIDESKAGGLWAWFGFLSIFSGILFGAISDRIGRRAGIAVAFAVLASAYLLVGFGPWMPGLYISVALFGLAAWSIPVIMAAASGDFFGPDGAANALAIFTLVFSAGQAGGPVLAGFLAERTGGFSTSYAVAGGLALSAIVLALMLRPPASD